MKISGWGGYPVKDAEVRIPRSSREVGLRLDRTAIARGAGRSYGDSAVADTVLQTDYLDHFVAFDEATGILTVQAGVTIREILRLFVPRGWFVPVTPGTSYVTVAGAVASDVHGKNHHVAGTFGDHVLGLKIMLGSGDVVSTSRTELPDLFHATCGGMGLTGVILEVALALIPIRSSLIEQQTLKAGTLDQSCEQFSQNAESTYSVAWIDCVTSGSSMGRSVLMLGEHAQTGGLDFKFKNPPSMPFHLPASLLSRRTVGAFNQLYYSRAKHQQERRVSLVPYFYPLDAIGRWNRLYGKRGFVQYQFVIPKEDGLANLRRIMARIVASGSGSFLAVLKQFGAQNDNLLSFPMEGYTLALDFKVSTSTFELLSNLDVLVADMGGRVYLAKDAVMLEQTFKRMYKRWEEFESIREKYGAIGRFASSQSKRLGLA